MLSKFEVFAIVYGIVMHILFYGYTLEQEVLHKNTIKIISLCVCVSILLGLAVVGLKFLVWG